MKTTTNKLTTLTCILFTFIISIHTFAQLSYKEKIIDIPGNETAVKLSKTIDGYMYAGYVSSQLYPNDDSLFFGKLNVNGDSAWVKYYNLSIYPQWWYDSETISSMVALPDGGCIIAGLCRNDNMSYNMDEFVMRIDSSGNIIWRKTFDFFQSVDDCTDMLLSSDGNIVICGIAAHEFPTYHKHFFVQKIDMNGNILWSYVDNSGDNPVMNRPASNIAEIDNSLYYVVAHQDTSYAMDNSILFVFSPNGNLDTSFSIMTNVENRYVSAMANYNNDLLLSYQKAGYKTKMALLNKNGQKLSKTASSIESLPKEILITSNNDIALSGFYYQGSYLKTDDITPSFCLFDSSLTEVYANIYTDGLSIDTNVHYNELSVVETNTKNEFIYMWNTDDALAGTDTINTDFSNIKFKVIPSLITAVATSIANNESNSNTILLSYFLTVDNMLIIHLNNLLNKKSTAFELFDINGKKLWQENSLQNNISINLSNLSGGIYFVKAFTNEQSASFKFVLPK